jgi:hypothetical protein
MSDFFCESGAAAQVQSSPKRKNKTVTTPPSVFAWNAGTNTSLILYIIYYIFKEYLYKTKT